MEFYHDHYTEAQASIVDAAKEKYLENKTALDAQIAVMRSEREANLKRYNEVVGPIHDEIYRKLFASSMKPENVLGRRIDELGGAETVLHMLENEVSPLSDEARLVLRVEELGGPAAVVQLLQRFASP